MAEFDVVEPFVRIDARACSVEADAGRPLLLNPQALDADLVEPIGKPQTDVRYVHGLSELDQYAGDWDRLAALGNRFFPSYAEARGELETQEVLGAIETVDGRAEAICCFVHRSGEQRFAVGERHLFALPARETALFGQNVLGVFSETALEQILRRAFHEWPCHLLTLGETEKSSPLIKATRALGLVKTRRQRKNPIHWSISLPRTFEAYLAALRRSTRKSIRYTLRRFERELDYHHEVITRPNQVRRFLREGERISRRTYQWNVGQRLVDDEETRRRYVRLAQAGRLRCHLVHVDGTPCAFSRGTISGRVFHYETPGFVLEHHRYSPGLVLLMWTIRDLIENTDCRWFDFGRGGDDHDYKSRFGNHSVECVDLQLASVWRPYSAFLFLTYGMVALLKDAASRALGAGLLRQRVKKAIRVRPGF